MQNYLEGFTSFLSWEKKMSPNSMKAYSRDVAEFGEFLQERQVADITETKGADVAAYLLTLKNDGKSASTVNRKLASVRAFFSYLKNQGILTANPAEQIKSPKIQRKPMEYLTVEEVEKLLDSPDDSLLGIRDRAILELLYATGLRVGELAAVNLSDINLRIGFITCSGEFGKARIIPLGRPARSALESYIYDCRPGLVRENTEETALCVNYNGHRLTRQGIWKLLKEYAAKVGLEDRLTPQTLRNSFAVHMIQNGADLKSLQELLGHEDISATQAYLFAAKGHIKDVYDRAHPRA